MDMPMQKDPITGWYNGVKRTGAVGIKLGMTADWDDLGRKQVLTVIKIPDCQVVQVKTPETDGHYALQVGAGDTKIKHTTKPMMGHFAAAGLPPKRTLMEFPVTPDCLLPVGTTIYAQHFIVNQKVNVQGVTIGKGFQGVMKRWGFGGQPATHGVSRTHRSLGSTGNRQTPGRVFPGKKMPGRMGGKTRTALNLTVFKIDPYLNTIYVRGHVAGHKNGFVKVFDTPHQKYINDSPPVPTYIPKAGEQVPYIHRQYLDWLPDDLDINTPHTDPDYLLQQAWVRLGGASMTKPSQRTNSAPKEGPKPQNMTDLIKAALAKREADKAAITLRQKEEKDKQKKKVKGTKKKVIDFDDE